MLELAILGALKEKPMHGYELKKRLSFLLGHLWKISFGSLYPALKRLEAKDAVERAYTVKEKTRNRYVYRITPKGEEIFRKLLEDTGKSSEITDSDKFSLRLAFFQYLEPELRLWLLEKRRNYLAERLEEISGTGKSRYKESDSYRLGLFRHRQELLRSDIRWLDELIEQERKHLLEKERERGTSRKGEKGGEKLLLEGESLKKATPIQA
ncbi:PadR family transcriptional regulator [Candidatus Solincola sp.]|nr:PadR family transcriptional regulator [Actinomycetota bacterium]MDI7252720.1 PadR family transcriptional regulator [Actinomycetota bacterium]